MTKPRRLTADWHIEADRLKAAGVTAEEASIILGKAKNTIYHAWKRESAKDRKRRVATMLINRKIEKAIIEAYLEYPDYGPGPLAKIAGTTTDEINRVLASKGLPPARGKTMTAISNAGTGAKA